MEKKPFLTFLSSVYNGEKYLKKFLESLKNQTCQDFEAVFWNDGSTDGSCAIIEEFIKENSGKEGQYRLYHAEKNMGGFHFCLSKVGDYLNGEYLFLITQDDFLEKDFVELCRQKAQEKDYDVILTNAALFYDGNTRFIGRNYLEDFANGKLTNKDLFELGLTFKVSTAGCRKKSLLQKDGLFVDTYYNIDEYVTRKTLLTANAIAYADTTYYYRVDNPNALTKKVKPFTFDILTTDIMLTDLMVENGFEKDAIVRQIKKLISENNYYVFRFFENVDTFKEQDVLKVKEKLNDAYTRIKALSFTYGVDVKNLYDTDQVEQGVCYKTKGIPYVFQLLTCRKREKKLRGVKLFGFKIAEWPVKGK